MKFVVRRQSTLIIRQIVDFCPSGLRTACSLDFTYMLTPLPRYYELSSTTLATIVVTYELRRATILLYFTEEEKRENDPNFVSVSIGQQHSYLPSLFEGGMTQAFANKVTMYPCQYYHHLIRRRSNT